MAKSVDEVTKLIINLRDHYYSARRAKQMEVDRLYNLEYENFLATADVTMHVPSTAASIINHLREQINTADPRVTVLPKSNSESDIKRSKEQTLLYQAILDTVLENEDVNFVEGIVFDLCLRGEGCTLALPIEDEDFPVLVRAIDPYNIFVAPVARYPYPYVIEEQRRYIDTVVAEYPYWPNPQGLKPGDIELPVVFHAYWSLDEKVYLADSVEVSIPEHSKGGRANPWGIIPYAHGYSGWGRRDYTGDPAKLAISALDKVVSELKAEVRFKTALDVAAQFGVFPIYLTEDDPKEIRKNMTPKPGAIVPVSDLDRSLKPLGRPDFPVEAYQFLSGLQNSIVSGTYSPSITGQRPPGVDYGYLYNSINAQARQILRAPIKAAERILARTLRNVAVFLYHGLDENFSTTDLRRRLGEKVTKRDLQENVRIEVRLAAMTDVEKEQRRLGYLNDVRAGTMSLRDYLVEGREVKDVDDEIAHIYADVMVKSLISSPQMLQILLSSLQMEEENQQETSTRDNLVGQLRNNLGFTE